MTNDTHLYYGSMIPGDVNATPLKAEIALHLLRSSPGEFSLEIRQGAVRAGVSLPVACIPELFDRLHKIHAFALGAQALAGEGEEVLQGYADAIRSAEGEGGAR